MKRRGAIGLTGGIACGKSEVGAILERRGIPVLDTDAVAHRLLEPGGSLCAAVADALGAEYLRPDGGIDRRRLGDHVFGDTQARAKLNGLMHPVIFAEMDDWLDRQLAAMERAVVMVPLLFETGADRRVEQVMVVATDEATVRQRLTARGLRAEQIDARVAAQWPLDEKVRRADAVVWNNGTLDELNTETWKIWNQYILGKEEEA